MSNDYSIIIRQLHCYLEDRFRVPQAVVWYDLLGDNGVEFVWRDIDTGVNWTGYVRFSRLWESWAKDSRSIKEYLEHVT